MLKASPVLAEEDVANMAAGGRGRRSRLALAALGAFLLLLILAMAIAFIPLSKDSKLLTKLTRFDFFILFFLL